MTVLKRCGVRAALAGACTAMLMSAPSGAEELDHGAYVLAASWEPAFCETRPQKPECRSQHEGRYDADHFALHGLWPDAGYYCDVPLYLEQRDREGDWMDLPALRLGAETAQALERVMPGTQSGLERHEWVKHGTCSGTNAEAYYAASVGLMDTLNGSGLRELFAQHIGQELTLDEIRSVFEDAFGDYAGRALSLHCADDHGRRLISEIRIALVGAPDEAGDIAELARTASAHGTNCQSGIVDPVGLQ